MVAVNWSVEGETATGRVNERAEFGLEIVATPDLTFDDSRAERWLYDWCLDWYELPRTRDVEVDRSGRSPRISIRAVLDRTAVETLRRYRDQLAKLAHVTDAAHVDCRLTYDPTSNAHR